MHCVQLVLTSAYPRKNANKNRYLCTMLSVAAVCNIAEKALRHTALVLPKVSTFKKCPRKCPQKCPRGVHEESRFETTQSVHEKSVPWTLLGHFLVSGVIMRKLLRLSAESLLLRVHAARHLEASREGGVGGIVCHSVTGSEPLIPLGPV